MVPAAGFVMYYTIRVLSNYQKSSITGFVMREYTIRYNRNEPIILKEADDAVR